jgi:type IV pilus assembly protein PilW
MADTRRNQTGFSVIEAIVSMALFLIVMTAVLSAYTPSRLIHARGEVRTDVQQNARLGMAEMSRQIRMAGYFPENFSDAPPSPALQDPILIATDQFLAIHGAADGGTVTAAFAFCRDGNVLRRTQGPIDEDEPFECTGGDVLAENVTALRFTYYDEDGAPVPDPPGAPYALDDIEPGSAPDLDDTTVRATVRRVVVALTVEADSPQGGVQSYHLVSDAWLRNAG